MEFQGTWIIDDTDALDETCDVLISTAAQTVADEYGLGGASTEPIIEEYSLACSIVPETVRIEYESGLRVVIPKDLIVNDPLERVQAQRVIVYNGRRYQIRSFLSAPQHTLKRVQIDPIGAA